MINALVLSDWAVLFPLMDKYLASYKLEKSACRAL